MMVYFPPSQPPLHLLPLTYFQLATIPLGLTPGEESSKDFLLAWEAEKLVEASRLKTRKRALPSFALQLQPSHTPYPVSTFDAYVSSQVRGIFAVKFLNRIHACLA